MFHDVISPNRILTGPGAQAGAIQHHSGLPGLSRALCFPRDQRGLDAGLPYGISWKPPSMPTWWVSVAMPQVWSDPSMKYLSFRNWSTSADGNSISANTGLTVTAAGGWKVKKMISTSSSATSLKWTFKVSLSLFERRLKPHCSARLNTESPTKS